MRRARHGHGAVVALAGLAAALGALLAAGCSPTGIVATFEVTPGCPSPHSFTISLSATPGGAMGSEVGDGTWFTSGAHTLDVAAPDGTTAVTATVTMLDGKTVNGPSVTLPIDHGAGTYSGNFTVGGACNDLGASDLAMRDAAPADLGARDLLMVDQSAPDLARPDLLVADLTVLDLSKPDLATPDLSTPDLSHPDLASPDLAKPATPDLSPPDLATPDLSKPDLSTPDLATPDLATPDLSKPDLSTPDLAAPDLSIPDLFAPDLSTPDLAMPDLERPDLSMAPPVDMTRPDDLTPARDLAVIHDLTPPPDLAGLALSTLSFGVAQTFGGTGGVSNVAVADFNGDGISDVLASQAYIASVLVLRGNANGTLSALGPITATAGSSVDPVDIAAADFDGDGRIDFALADYGANAVVVNVNQSISGGFQFSVTRISLPLTGANTLAIADLDGDGHPDIVAAGDTQVRWFRNTSAVGTVSFAAGVVVATTCADPGGGYPAVVRIAAGDFDGDGHTDVALACAVNGIDLDYNTASATDPAPTASHLLGAYHVYDAITANLDGNAIADLVVATYPSSSGEDLGYVIAMLGQSGATFTQQLDDSVAYPGRLGVGRFFGHATDDVVTQGDDGLLGLLPGQGNGLFGPPVYRVAPGFPTTGLAPIAIGGDPNTLDLVAADSLRQEVGLILDVSTSTTSSPGAIATDSTGEQRKLAVGDVDGVNGPDLVVSSDQVRIYTETSGGGFGPPYVYDFAASAVALGNIQGQPGELDLLLGSTDDAGFSWALNLGGASFATYAPTQDHSEFLFTLRAAALNGTGFASAYGAAEFYTGPSTPSGRVHATAWIAGAGPSYTLRDFGPMAQLSTVIDPGDALGMAALDTDGNGTQDIVYVLSSSQLQIELNDGSGNFTAGGTLTTIASPTTLLPLDVDGDGSLDLVVAGGATTGTPPGHLATHLSTQLGTALASATTVREPVAMTSADFNRDGKVDVAVLGYEGDVDVHLGNGDGTFQAALRITPVSLGYDIAAIDIDRDGRIDLAVSDGEYSGYVALVLNTSH